MLERGSPLNHVVSAAGPGVEPVQQGVAQCVPANRTPPGDRIGFLTDCFAVDLGQYPEVLIPEPDRLASWTRGPVEPGRSAASS